MTANAFLQGGGTMGALMRDHDWSTTSLGLPRQWPASLRSAVGICLGTSFPIAIYWGSDLSLIYNDAWSDIPGKKHPWALGRPGREVWPEIWDAIGPLFEKVQATGEGVWQQDQLLPMRRHGYTEECYFNFTFSPIRGETGAVEGIFNAVIETTFRVIAERRERLLRTLAEKLAAARSEGDVYSIAARVLAQDSADLPFSLFYRLDDDGKRVEPIGTADRHDAGATDAPSFVDLRTVPWPLAEVMQGGRAETVTFPEGWASHIQSEPARDPIVTALVVPIVVTGTAGAIAGFLVAGLSPRRALDEEYRTFVERVAGHVAANLSSARAYEEERRRAEALAEIDRAKTLFFSNVSHEFRTPLTLMLGPLEDTLSLAGELPEAARERIAVAHRNGLRLLKLVNSLLDFSRIEAGRVVANFEATDLSALTAELASNFRSATERAGLRLVVDCPPLPEPVHVDRDMWEKIVLNLLSNAFKFTFEGAITVQLRASDGSAELRVQDTGTGIPEHELPRVFERFHRIEGARGRSFEGSGIGLALIRELAGLHQGSIRVESREGQGSTFTVAIPFGVRHLPQDRVHRERTSPSTAVRTTAYVEEALRWLPGQAPARENAADRSPRSPLDAPPDARRARILVADDNADMRDYIRRLLATAHAVETAPDGQAALEAMRQQRPDLLLTDIMMPGMDGFGLIRAVRGDETLQDIPVIVLSARAGADASVEGLAAGANDYLAKPFSARELLARVDSALTMARLRREASEALRESEARFRNMADYAPVMIWTTDTSGYCTFLSQSWFHFTGQTRETGLGYGWLDATHPDDKARSQEMFTAANAHRLPFALEYRLRKRDGSYAWAIDAASPWFGKDGEFMGYIGSVIDITERKQLEDGQRALNEILEQRVAEEIGRRSTAEEQLRQAQKMEAIGHLTGGVAHDFNNLLTIVIGNLDMLQRHLPDGVPDRTRRATENAMQGAKRAASLTQRLLAFSRRQPLDPKPTALNRLVSSMTELLGRTLGESIEVQTVLAGGLWTVESDRNQLESTLLNLAVNARDAMPDGGKLTIETANAHLDEHYVGREAEVRAGQYVVLAVSDTGTGMSKETLGRAFEPFFTTKPTGHGTGLGLSQVYGFVKQSGGHVKLYSEPGQGTTVKIYLPRFSGTGEDDELPAPTIPDGHRDELILIVEDEDGVREYSAGILRELGYSIVEASDGPTALRQLDKHPAITLLFTDVGLPGMNGRELAIEAMRRRPGLKVLYTTGYARNAIVHHGRLDSGLQMIGKPFTFADLAAKIRSVIDQPE